MLFSTMTEPAQKSVPEGAEGHRQRLRERFERAGFAGFADHEVIELILTLCIPRRDVKPLARRLLKRFGTVRALLDAPAEELREVEGVGTVTPVALRILRETANLYLQQCAEDEEALSSTDKLETFWRSRLGGLKREVFEIGYFDTAYRLVQGGIERLEEGTVNRAMVYPRKVMEAALRRGASNIVVVHNHPNGVPRPSDADIRLTQALREAAGALSIRLLDHLIITRAAVFSFRREGLLPDERR